MAELSGMNEVRVDDRNRVALPARPLEQFRMIASEDGAPVAEEGMEVVVGMGLGKNLCVFPKNVHRKVVEYLESKPKFDPKWNKVRQMVMGSAEVQTMDKQNRVRIPALLGTKLNLVGDIVVMGVNDHFELVNKAAWEKSFDEFQTEIDTLS